MAINILLIDLSSITHLMFHTSGNDPDPDATSTKTVERVRALASGQPHCAICLDSPPYFRRDVDPTYKAQRDKDNNAVIGHQLALAADRLRADGFPIWGVKGYEADDIIASATTMFHGAEMPGTFLIATADKDLAQLVSHTVSLKSLRDGALVGPDEVKAKFGVWPHQMRDYLALVGDASDNIRGAKGIGPKRAAEILDLYGNLDDALVSAMAGNGFTPAIAKALQELQPRLATVRELIALRTDVPLPFDEVLKERQPTDFATRDHAGIAADIEETMTELTIEAPQVPLPLDVVPQMAPPAAQYAPRTTPVVPVAAEPDVATFAPNAAQQAANEAIRQRIAAEVQQGRPGTVTSQATTITLPPPARVLEPEVLPPPSDEFAMQLEPRSYGQAKAMASDLAASRLFSAWGSPAAVLAVVLSGREFGMQAMQSLRAFDNIDGRPTMKADLIRALVLKSGLALYFRCTERTAEKATFETHRKGDPTPIALTYTVQEGRTAWAKGDKAWDASGWGRNCADMLVARAGAKLARLVYPDVTHGLISGEEME
jgi:5'-3' exonuclease